jgi:hypothetical protein
MSPRFLPVSVGAAFVAIFALALAQDKDSDRWNELFATDLSNAVGAEGVWTWEDGVLTASKDECLWTERDYDNFVLDLKLKTAKEWNHYKITCKDKVITVVLNGEQDPGGSKIPPWLSTPFAELPTKGKIGLQGKLQGAPIYFKDLKIKELK